MSKGLLTGGSGLLGRELQKYFDLYAPPHKELDITKPKTLKGTFDLIVHCAAYTDVAKAEREKEKCFDINVIGTKNLLEAYPESHFIYISTEYAYNPVNFYTSTKLMAEALVKQHPSHLIIRTLFKPTPWPYPVAYIDQYTTGDYVDVIAPKIVTHMLLGTLGMIDIGTGRKTMFELARRTRPDVLGNLVDDYKGVKIPRDYARA